VRELRPGLWHWEARHPEWESSEPWGPEVSSYAIADGERLLLFDPLGVPQEVEALASDRETAIVLTCPWHERDTQTLVQRIDAPVFTPAPDTGEDLMEVYGVSAEQAAGFVSPDVRWLLHGDAARARLYGAGDRLPVGVEAFPGQKRNDMVLWIESMNTVIAGDTLVEWGQGLHINPRWIPKGMTREQVAAPLRPLLERPVEHVLPTHGAPTDRAALERALS
jgi:glyoxylase-like metal-dependent hydrolase (beta-lactamase superfamily II)